MQHSQWAELEDVISCFCESFLVHSPFFLVLELAMDGDEAMDGSFLGHIRIFLA